MKLYMHPASSTCRPILLMLAEHKLDITPEVVDLMTGAHHQDSYASKNPNKLVPLLEDGDFRLTESAAILKFLAVKFDLPVYPKDPIKQARVDERMSWFNTQLVRDYLYNLAYPQLFDHHKRPTEEAQRETLSWGKNKSAVWLKVLNDNWIGPDNAYVCGNEISIADYFGACLITVGEITRCNLSVYPNITRWLGNMKQLKSWNQVNEALHGFTQAMKDTSFVAV